MHYWYKTPIVISEFILAIKKGLEFDACYCVYENAIFERTENAYFFSVVKRFGYLLKCVFECGRVIICTWQYWKKNGSRWRPSRYVSSCQRGMLIRRTSSYEIATTGHAYTTNSMQLTLRFQARRCTLATADGNTRLDPAIPRIRRMPCPRSHITAFVAETQSWESSEIVDIATTTSPLEGIRRVGRLKRKYTLAAWQL